MKELSIYLVILFICWKVGNHEGEIKILKRKIAELMGRDK